MFVDWIDNVNMIHLTAVMVACNKTAVISMIDVCPSLVLRSHPNLKGGCGLETRLFIVRRDTCLYEQYLRSNTVKL